MHTAMVQHTRHRILASLGPAALLFAFIACGGGGSSAGGNHSSGQLDSSFGQTGAVLVNPGALDDRSMGVAVQADGKIVMAGYTQISATSSPNPKDVLVARFLPNGTPDPGFGDQGLVRSNFGDILNQANSILMQADGKMVVAGQVTTAEGSCMAAARYLRNGTLDPDFGTQGLAAIHHEWGGGASRVIKQPDGKLLLAGWHAPIIPNGTGWEEVFGLARLNTDGSLDAGFGSGGYATTTFVGGDELATDLALQSDGSILVVGAMSLDHNWRTSQAGLARFSASGQLDTSFGSGGRILLSLNDLTVLSRVAVQSDGKILALGTSSTQWGDFATLTVVRYDAQGTLDPSFGTTGVVRSYLGGNHAEGYALALLPGGGFLAGGSRDSHLAVARFTANGDLDPAFGAKGCFIRDAGTYGQILDLTLQKDGSILATGWDWLVDSPDRRMITLRLLP